MPKFSQTVILLGVLLIGSSCSGGSTSSSTVTTSFGSGTTAAYTPTSASNSTVSSNKATSGNTSFNQAGHSPIVPAPKLTPGDALDVTKADICVSGYSKKVRSIAMFRVDKGVMEYAD